ncbi:MAG: hypothetical protein SFU25_04080 [Candidatus Caenarcaniphilales bacterium]|nr:hypothetical protein [Candidatus Caenarcaniphilales bacterium]
MKTEKKNFFQNFANALNKIFKLKSKNFSDNLSSLSLEDHSNNQQASFINFSNTLCLGQTKGYADFLPSQSWQWFTSIKN